MVDCAPGRVRGESGYFGVHKISKTMFQARLPRRPSVAPTDPRQRAQLFSYVAVCTSEDARECATALARVCKRALEVEGESDEEGEEECE